MSDVIQVPADKSTIKFSPTALRHVLGYLEKEGRKGVRLSVKKTGCSGFSYVVDFIKDSSDTQDIIQTLPKGYVLSVDKNSYPFLKGMEIDYVKQGFNFKFIFNNPNQTGQCGCGESFTVDAN
jgi:iron-sulfur cluster assembly protein